MDEYVDIGSLVGDDEVEIGSLIQSKPFAGFSPERPAVNTSQPILLEQIYGDVPERDMDERIFIRDTRKVHPVTGQPINPNRDLKTGRYNMNTIARIIAESKAQGYDPYKALAVGLMESGLGNTDENVGHVLQAYTPPKGTTRMVTSGVDGIRIGQMVSTLKRAEELARKTKDYNTDEYALQAYNSPAVLQGKPVLLTTNAEKEYHNNTGRGTRYFYGVDVSKTPLNLRDNPAYGKTVMSLVDILKQNAEIQALMDMNNPIHESLKWSPNTDTAPTATPSHALMFGAIQ